MVVAAVFLGGDLMFDKVEVLANAWGITPEEMRTLAKRFGCLSDDGVAIASSLLHDRIEEAGRAAATPD